VTENGLKVRTSKQIEWGKREMIRRSELTNACLCRRAHPLGSSGKGGDTTKSRT